MHTIYTRLHHYQRYYITSMQTDSDLGYLSHSTPWGLLKETYVIEGSTILKARQGTPTILLNLRNGVLWYIITQRECPKLRDYSPWHCIT